MKAVIKKVGATSLGNRCYVASPERDEDGDIRFDGSDRAYQFDSYTDAGEWIDDLRRADGNFQVEPS